MSNTNNSSNMEFFSFALVVEGDVAFTIKIPKQAQAAVAAMRSSPQIIEVSEDLSAAVQMGWTFDGENFISPQ